MNKKIFFLAITLIFSCLCADDITVINHTDAPIWVGLYRIKSNLLGKSVGNARLQNEIVQIAADERAKLERPNFKAKTNRELIFSDNEDMLKNDFDFDEYNLNDHMI